MLEQLRRYWKLILGGAAALAVVVTFVVANSGSDEPAPSGDATTTTSPAAGESVAPPTPSDSGAGDGAPVEPASRDPLTGQPLDSPSFQQVVAVRVGNGDSERPQTGLGQAGLVVETLLEGGETRFVAFYFGEQPTTVGPVRSLRPVDAAIVAPFEPLFVFSGGQDFVYRLVRAATVDVVDEGDTQALRRTDGVPPHNLVFDFAVGMSRATGGPPAVDPIPVGGEWSATGESADTIGFTLGTRFIEYSYDEDLGYVRRQDSADFDVIGDDGPEPFVRDTVVVQFVAERSAGYSDAAGAEVPDFDVVGFGAAMAFHRGEMVELTWRRGSQASGTLLFSVDGAPFDLPTGRIIIELLPVGTQVTFE